jgi:hypothetical protein
MSNISKNLANVNISKERIYAESSGKIFAELLEAQQKDIAEAIAEQHKTAAEMFNEQLSSMQTRPQATPAVRSIFQRYMAEGEFEKAIELADTYDGLE